MTQAPEGGIGEAGQGPEVLSRREINSRTISILDAYATISLEKLRPMVRAGAGKEEMGMVRNRPGEVQHQIDLAGEGLLASIIRERGLPTRIIGENNDNYPLGVNIPPLVDMSIDPLDNTSQYVRSLDTLPYSVLGAYDTEGRAIGGVAVDIMGNKIYSASGSKVTVKDVESGVVRELRRSQRTNLSDEHVTIASFVGEKEYSIPFFENFHTMIEAMHPKGLLYPGGGSFVYALLASGAIDAYVMPNEPRSEIDPGLPMLLIAGGKADVIDLETGKATPYRYDREKSASESVPLFIAYSMPEIRDQIIEQYLKNKSRLAEQSEALSFYREMQAGRAFHIPQA